MIEYQVYSNALAYLPEYGQSDCGFSLGDVQVYLWMLGCGNIVLLTVRFLNVAKFTNLNPLSLLISCKLSLLIIGLKMFSLSTLALRSPNRIFIQFLRNLRNTPSYSSVLFSVGASTFSTKMTSISIMHDMLTLLTNLSLLTANISCKGNVYLIHYSHSPFRTEMCVLPIFRCHHSPN
jgi:hypothetical protein